MARFGVLFVLLPVAFALAGCQQPVLAPTLAAEPTCDRAAEHIAVLDHERTATRERIAAGLKSVVPHSAVVHLLRGELRREVAVATGDYDRLLEARIAEIRTRCGH